MGSNTTIAYEQCVALQPYTTVEQYLRDKGLAPALAPAPEPSSAPMVEVSGGVAPESMAAQETTEMSPSSASEPEKSGSVGTMDSKVRSTMNID